MEALLIGYAIFALTTALASLITLLRPVLAELWIAEPLNMLVQYKGLTYVTFFVIGLLLAPILVFSTIVPTYNEVFKTTLITSLRN